MHVPGNLLLSSVSLGGLGLIVAFRERIEYHGSVQIDTIAWNQIMGSGIHIFFQVHTLPGVNYDSLNACLYETNLLQMRY